MACTPIPQLTPPTLGLGLSLEPPALPGFSGDLTLCCKLLAFEIPPPPIQLPPLVINAAFPILSSVFAAVNSYLDQLSFECPKED